MPPVSSLIALAGSARPSGRIAVPVRWLSGKRRPCRTFWRETRSVDNLAHVQRFINFAFLYPRYRDVRYLTNYLARWDQAILALLPHSGYFPQLPDNPVVQRIRQGMLAWRFHTHHKYLLLCFHVRH